MQGRRLRRAGAVAAAMVLALGVVACGGGDDGDDEEQVRTTVEEILTSNDPETCQRITDGLLERSTGQTGDEALSTCEEQITQGEPPEDVSVDEVTVDGETAEAALSAGGETADARLLKDGDEWKLDDISFAPSEPSGEDQGAGEGESEGGAQGDNGGGQGGGGQGGGGEE
jgi:hypothetical protein